MNKTPMHVWVAFGMDIIFNPCINYFHITATKNT